MGEWFERTNSIYHTKRDLDPWDCVREGRVGEWFEHTNSVYHTKRDLDPWERVS